MSNRGFRTTAGPGPVSMGALWGILLAAGVFLTGCTVTQTVYLQELNTTTSVAQPPLHLNAGDSATSVHLSPRLTTNAVRVMTGDIEGSGPYKTTDRNLRWNIPAMAFGVDADVRLSRVVALTCGVNYSNADNRGFWGGNLGLGLLFGGSDIGGRIDAGMSFQSVSYEAASVVVTETSGWFSSTRTVEYFYDAGSEGAATFYGSLTLNTKARESFINGYLQLAVGAQQLADFHPSNRHWEGPFVDQTYTDARVQSSSTYVMLSPGLYFNLSESVRLLAGVRIAWDLEIEDVSPGTLALPMVQCDFSL